MNKYEKLILGSEYEKHLPDTAALSNPVPVIVGEDIAVQMFSYWAPLSGGYYPPYGIFTVNAAADRVLSWQPLEEDETLKQDFPAITYERYCELKEDAEKYLNTERVFSAYSAQGKSDWALYLNILKEISGTQISDYQKLFPEFFTWLEGKDTE